MIYLKWLVLAIFDWILLLTVPFAAVIIALFTREQPRGLAPYKWGWIWGTYDNPPQGDEGFVRKRSLFVGVTTGFKGYLNRVHWMIRNPLYGYAKRTSVAWEEGVEISGTGDFNISDKEKRPGSYFAVAKLEGKVIAFEYYLVKPYSETRDIRVRLGWKIMTDKYKRYGFAQLVNSINPFDGYGDE